MQQIQTGKKHTLRSKELQLDYYIFNQQFLQFSFSREFN